MINIVAVHVGNYCDRGLEYIDRLFDGFAWHLPSPHNSKFWCITDGKVPLPNYIEPIPADDLVKGWWNKIALFRPGALPKGERILYSDLDSVPVGDLSGIAAYSGRFAGLRDFYHPQMLGSSLMAWEAGTLDHIWRTWDRCGRPQHDPWGDQSWIGTVEPRFDHWQNILPGHVVSYKMDCKDGVPAGARMVCFHGKPRPHEVNFLT